MYTFYCPLIALKSFLNTVFLKHEFYRLEPGAFEYVFMCVINGGTWIHTYDAIFNPY